MSLKLQPFKRVYRCRVRTILENLEPKDREILTQALADEEAWPARHLANQLRDNNFHLSEGPIWAHRKGDCSCSRT